MRKGTIIKPPYQVAQFDVTVSAVLTKNLTANVAFFRQTLAVLKDTK